MQRTFRIFISMLTVIAATVATVAAAAPVVTSAAGLAAATAARNNFRILLGGGATGSANGSFGAARREVNWDGVPDAASAPNVFPANFFNTTSPRGLVLATPGTNFQVSATTASGTPVRFGNINASYSTTFAAFSAERLFTPIGSNVTDVSFALPGRAISATVSGFGVMFTDVDNANTTSLQFFDHANTSIGTFFAPTAGNDISFLGVYFNGGERISRVRITTGNAALSPADTPPTTDVVAMDDFIYSEPQLVAQAVAPAMVYAYERNSQRVVGFLSDAPGIIVSSLPLAGLAATDQVLAMDFRPATGQLFAVVAPTGSAAGRMVTINRASGAVTTVGAITVDVGVSYGMTFNAIIDGIRLVTDGNSNRRYNPGTGVLVGNDTNLAYAPTDVAFGANPAISHIAATNHYFGATQTTLYGIDTTLSTLVLLGSPSGIASSPNLGQLTTVGPLGIGATNPTSVGGFDIQPGANHGLAAFQSGTASYLYRIDLATGTSTHIGIIGDGSFAIDGLAIFGPSQCLDVDGDGRADALTDGLVLLRALFGLTGSAATDAVTTPSSSRPNWAAMRGHLNANCGLSLQP